MEALFYVILGLLFVLAISDLVVGVGNDAVNFLNSAVGSKATSFRVILLIAGLGVVIGAIMSNGMMEVARKGLFHPNMFMFSEIMLIFLAVMLTDVLLLDFFNTFGIPTSTTVSLIFEILGAAVAMALIKISFSGDSISTLGDYINSDKALAIITGILLSVVIAFTVGSILQYFSRLLFSFRYEKNLKYFAGIFGGMAITGITYFLLIKGLKDSAIISKEMYTFISDNTVYILLISFASFTILLQLLYSLFRVNVLKIVVVLGTFALAMAFAGNDLVNFIGVPLAGLKSFQLYQADMASASPDTYSMGALAEPVQTDVYILLIAGLIMMMTLWLSKKARTVLETSIKLSKQDNRGKEQFGSSYLARIIVQGVSSMTKGVNKVIPEKLKAKINNRFQQDVQQRTAKSIPEDKPAFDLVRAAVNTLAASFLIAMGTSLKLPLSTTYVTFMVAMGTSMADRAWGRESAVYRVTGVLTVVASWFFTAFIAFTAAAVVLSILKLGGIIGLGIMIALAIFLLLRSHLAHRNRETSKHTEEDKISKLQKLQPEELRDNTINDAVSLLNSTFDIYTHTFDALFTEDRKTLKKLNKEVNQLNKVSKKNKELSYELSSLMPENNYSIFNINIQISQTVRELTYCLNYITPPAYLHINNVHNPLSQEQKEDMTGIIDTMKKLYTVFIEGISNKKMDYETFNKLQGKLLEDIEDYRTGQMKRTRNENQYNRTSLLFLGFLHETGNMVLHMSNLVNYCKNAQDGC
jgi:phosphate/sulfate permease